MKNPIKILVVATLSSLALAPFSAAALENFLPGDTLALAKIENIEKLEQQSKTNPLAAELNAKIFTPFLAEVKASDEGTSKEFSEFSATCAELAEIFSGEVLFAVVNRKGTLNPVILADCSGVADLEKVAELYKKSNPDATLEPVGVAGVDAMKSGKDCFTVVGKTFILSDDVDALKEFVKSIMTSSSVKQKKAKGKLLADSAEFNKARERIGDADFWVYADGKTIAKVIYAAAEEFDKKELEKAQDNPGALMFSVLMTPIAKAFAPEAVNSIWSSASFTADGAVSDSAISWNANKGIVTLLTASAKDGFEKPTLFPPSDDPASVSSSNFSFGKFALQLMSLAREATPLFGIAEMQIMNLKAAENLDVPATLTALDNGLFTYSLSAQKPKETVWVQNVSDEKLVGFALEKIGEKLAPEVSLVKVAGTPEFYNFVVDGENVVSAVFLNGKLCVGAPDMLKKIVAQAAKGEGAPSVWDNVNLKAGEALLPAGGCGISYAHLGKMIAATFAEIQGATVSAVCAAEARDVGDDGELVVVDETDASSVENIKNFFSKFKVEKGDFDYSVLSKTYLEENGISAKTVIYKNK
ncbi:MAG: hypothetical protein J6L64_06665 [Opitutales bacterium]|nr:hypothetical protein [Opitutales bacterium]